MALGYRGNATWRDMSEYVVHFTKEVTGRSAYDSMMMILSGLRLEPGLPLGAARKLGAITPPQSSTCLSEIPLDRLDRLVARRSQYGIGFRQDVVTAAGGGRVWYVDRDTALANAVWDAMKAASGPPMQADHPIWRLTPFIDFPGDYEGTQYRFEWEREWRVPGGLEFKPEQVAFLFIPEELHANAREFFDEARAEHRGPCYDCPFIDPLWPDEAIQAALPD